MSTRTAVHRLVPHDPHAEMTLLGAIMLDPRVFNECRKSGLSAGDFYAERHAMIFSALQRSVQDDGDTLAVQVASRLTESGTLERCGGDSYLDELLTSTPSAAAAPWAIKRVIECARLRRVIDAADKAVHSILNRGAAEDVDDLCNAAIERVSSAARARVIVRDTRLADAERAVLAQLQRRESCMLPTGIEGIDRDLGGIAASGLGVVYGYTSSGKTTLCIQIAGGLAQTQGRWVRVFSYEQPAKRIAATMLSAAAGVSVHERWNRGELPTDAEWDRLRKVLVDHDAMNFEIVEDNMNAAAIFARCVEYRDKNGPSGVVLVDYLQNLPPMAKDDVQSVAESMRWLQRIARDLELLVLVVSQVTRDASKSGQPPRLNEAFGGVPIESKADFIMAVYRPHLMEASPASDTDLDRMEWNRRQSITQVHLLKDKYGARGMAEMTFQLPLLRFH
ncbi:MAG: AAA family ATPase [Phycisphaeraceae bacterium]|nr:AAA family ATPase [Phycisphaeraceae bacterium]